MRHEAKAVIDTIVGGVVSDVPEHTTTDVVDETDETASAEQHNDTTTHDIVTYLFRKQYDLTYCKLADLPPGETIVDPDDETYSQPPEEIFGLQLHKVVDDFFQMSLVVTPEVLEKHYEKVDEYRALKSIPKDVLNAKGSASEASPSTAENIYNIAKKRRQGETVQKEMKGALRKKTKKVEAEKAN